MIPSTSLPVYGYRQVGTLPEMEPLLSQFYRQYLQQVPNPTYPPPQLLLHPDIQQQIYRYFFEGPLKGPVSYQRKILKRVISLVEAGVTDPDEDAVSDELMNHMGYLLSQPTSLTSNNHNHNYNSSSSSSSGQYMLTSLGTASLSAAQEAATTQIITYVLPDEFEALVHTTPRILIEEAPNLLAAGSNVGLRTWEASLHLAQYLYASGAGIINGKSVLELGAGTGLVSLLCAGPLRAKKVLATDGLPHVVEQLEKNVARNKHLFRGRKQDITNNNDDDGEDNEELEKPKEVNGREKTSPPPLSRVFDWQDLDHLDDLLDEFDSYTSFADASSGDAVKGTNAAAVDVIIGADITYSPDIVVHLAALLSSLTENVNPNLEILISATVRNERTLELFKEACIERKLNVYDVDTKEHCPKSIREQKGFFHEQHFPIVILKITARERR